MFQGRLRVEVDTIKLKSVGSGREKLTENINFNGIINDFAFKKTRKETLKLDMHFFIINRKIVGI